MRGHHYLQNTQKTQATVCFASLQIRFLRVCHGWICFTADRYPPFILLSVPCVARQGSGAAAGSRFAGRFVIGSPSSPLVRVALLADGWDVVSRGKDSGEVSGGGWRPRWREKKKRRGKAVCRKTGQKSLFCANFELSLCQPL